MSVKELLTHIEESVFEMNKETNEKLRSTMYLDVIEQLDFIRDALGLSRMGCEGCGVDGLYDCMECGSDFCGCCGDRGEDGFLCHLCKEKLAGKAHNIEMSHV